MNSEPQKIDDRLSEILFTQEQIDARAKEIAAQIDQDYKDVDNIPVFVVVLKGAILWAGDLMKHLKMDVETDFVSLSSYKGGTSSIGKIDLVTELTVDVSGRDVIIVEDIVDTALTLDYLKKYLVNEKGAKSAKVVTMLNKKAVRSADVEVEYTGFDIDDVFIVGYGLDYKEIWRNIPFIGVINPDKI